MGGFEGRALKRGDVIPYAPCVEHFLIEGGTAPAWSVSRALLDQVYSRDLVSFMKGPEWDCLSEPAKTSLQQDSFTITPDSNRTGYRLSGVPLERHRLGELLSGGAAFGTLQLLPSGQVILLMADHPVTGGYPRIGVAATADFPYLAQRPAGSELRFGLISPQDARGRIRGFEGQMQQFSQACSHRIEAWLAR